MFVTKQFAAAGLMACLTASAAHALTADQIWQDWQTNLSGVGATLTADPATTTGGVLTLRNIIIRAEGENVLTLDQVTLTETAGGAVQLDFPATFALAPPPQTDVTAALSLTQAGLVITITEPAPGARQYDYVAEKLTVAGNYTTMIDTFDGGPKQPDSADFTLDLGGLSGIYSDTPGTNRNFGLSFAASTAAVTVSQTGPYLGTSHQNSTAQDIAASGTFTLPATFDLTSMENPGQMADALRDGLAFSADFTQGAGTNDQSDASEFLNFAIVSETTGSAFRMRFDQGGALLAGESQPVIAKITSSDLPIPQIDLQVGPSALELKFPVLGPDMQDFRYMVKMDSITVNDAAWAAFDPTAVLARTPIVLDIDVTGRTSLDIFGMIQADENGGMPVIPQVERADIVRLLVSAAGAEVAGTGAFTFDNSLGFPMPRGNADFVVKGANKMINALITLGAINSDDAMGARMAIALILEPTTEPDVMTSKIEAREDGGFYVNGQRMQ